MSYNTSAELLLSSNAIAVIDSTSKTVSDEQQLIALPTVCVKAAGSPFSGIATQGAYETV
jgi:hypothetical protein